MEKGFIITVDNTDRYEVISKVEYNGVIYCYLGKIDGETEYFFAKIVNDDIEFIDDPNLVTEIAPLLVESAFN